MHTRRDILRLSASSALALSGAAAPNKGFAQSEPSWDQGELVHLLPTVSHDRLLVKASFKNPLPEQPVLVVDNNSYRGQQTDTRGESWEFNVPGLKSNTNYGLSLVAGRGRSLAEPWSLKTFPAPDDTPQHLRVLIYCCAGGHDALTPIDGKTRFLTTAIRRQLLLRGLSFAPDAIVANGDQVYWDLKAPRAAKLMGDSPEAISYAGRFDSKLPVLGTTNEWFLKRAAGPQITPLYGTLCRSTPVFFIQDDHDYFDNDEADDTVITFPPRHWMLDLARATSESLFSRTPPGCKSPVGPAWLLIGGSSTWSL